MTLTLGVAWALFVLAPGLAAFAALYKAGGGKILAPAPPPPSSLTALGIIIFGALVAHTCGASAFAVNEFIAQSLKYPIQVPWDPNPYAYFFSSRPRIGKEVGIEVAALLLLLSGLSALAYIGLRLMIGKAERDAVKISQKSQQKQLPALFRFLYGTWSGMLAQLAPEEGYTKHLAAYIVTDMENEGRWIGYEGEVESLSLNSDKQITHLTLSNSKAFYLTAGLYSLTHDVVERQRAIPRILIDKAQIKNLAFQVVFEAKTTSSVENPNA